MPAPIARSVFPLAAALLLPLLVSCTSSQAVEGGFDVVEATIPEMQRAMGEGEVTSRQLVEAYLQRIGLYEHRLNAVISVNTNALAEADRLDRERVEGRVRGPLHGIPVALKDNVHTTDVPTSGGALAFEGHYPPLRCNPDNAPQRGGCHHPCQNGDDGTRQLHGQRHAREVQRGGQLRAESL